MDVGIRELKSRLSHYLAKVREGDQIVVTDRGVPVARIEPYSIANLPPKLQALIKSGRATHNGPLRYLPRPVKMTPGDETSTDLIREQRR